MLLLADMILYIDNSKKNLLELINKVVKLVVYKIYIEKIVAFIYMSNKLSEK